MGLEGATGEGVSDGRLKGTGLDTRMEDLQRCTGVMPCSSNGAEGDALLYVVPFYSVSIFLLNFDQLITGESQRASQTHIKQP